MLTPLAGFAAGLAHVLSGPDHLAAIASLSVKHPRRSWLAGLRWGIGHASGVCVVGALSVLLRGLIPVDFISGSSDHLVGLLLIGIGAWALRKGLQIHSHEHTHEHGHESHEHIHMHGRREPHIAAKHVHRHAAFGIGALHGLAGSSHFLGILPALALPSNALAASYLLAFGVGTVLAMVLFSHFIGAIAARFQVRMWKAYRGMMFACSVIAFIVGATWLAGYSW